MSDLLIEAKFIQKTFKKGKISVPVLKGVDLKIARGETLAIVGSSGAGKSTLMHIMGTLDNPSSGKVMFYTKDKGVRDVFAISEEDRCTFRNRNIGFVFQFHHLLPEFTALENVVMPGLIAGRNESSLVAEAKNLLTEVGLAQRLQHKPGELSGGECQRVAIARALMMKPEILFGDELTGNLDSENSQHLIDLLLGLNKKYGVTLVLVTHDKAVAAKMSRVVEIRDGKILQ